MQQQEAGGWKGPIPLGMEGSRQTLGTTDGSEMLKPLRVLQSRCECTWRTGGKMTEVWTKDPAGRGVIDGQSEAGIQAWCCH